MPENNNIFVVLGIIGLIVAGPTLMSIFFPTTSCTLSPDLGTPAKCNVNLILPAGQKFDSVSFQVSATAKESGWIGPSAITLTPTISNSIGSSDLNGAWPCEGGFGTNPTCKRYYDYTITGLPSDYSQWELTTTSTFSYDMNANGAVSGDIEYCSFDTYIDNVKSCGVDYSCPPPGKAAFNPGIHLDDVNNDKDGSTQGCFGDNVAPTCRDTESFSFSSVKTKNAPTSTIRYEVRGQSQDGCVSSITSDLAQSSSTLRYKRNLLPTDSLLKVMSSSITLGSKSGPIGSGFTANGGDPVTLATTLNNYCGRNTGNTGECTIPLEMSGNVGGVINFVDTITASAVPAQSCGNNIKEGTEVCDGTSPGPQACTINGYSGTQSCNPTCTGYNSCVATQSCGDGIKNGPEACDSSDLGGATCTSLGYTSGTLSCSGTCTYNVGACTNPPAQTCGNGDLEGTEICDSSSQVCTINGYSGTQACNGACTGYGTCSSTQFCGDGIKNGNEVCDSDSVACPSGQSGNQQCNAQCTAYDSSQCSTQQQGGGGGGGGAPVIAPTTQPLTGEPVPVIEASASKISGTTIALIVGGAVLVYALSRRRRR